MGQIAVHSYFLLGASRVNIIFVKTTAFVSVLLALFCGTRGVLHKVAKSLFGRSRISGNDLMYYWGIHVGSLADRQGCGRNDKLMRMFGMCVNFNYSKPSGL